MRIMLIGRNSSTLVDDEDYEWLSLWNWSVTGAGYAMRNVYDPETQKSIKGILMHREIMRAGKGFEVDHKNGFPLDNRKNNLRISRHSQNIKNQAINIRNTSGFKGVSKSPGCENRWYARIVSDGKKYSLGSFGSPEEAHAAYVKASVDLHGEFANSGL